MVTGFIGKKVGMTQLFAADGTVQPATVLKAGPCVVAQVKTVETDGYEAVQLGLVEAKPTKENKPIAGPLQEGRRAGDARAPRGEGQGGRRCRRRPATRSTSRSSPTASASTSSARAAARASRASSSATTSRGGRMSHGSMFHRAPGSIGASSYPSRVVKGMRMGGHMGDDRVTVRNLKVLRVDAENNLLLRRGLGARRPERHRGDPQGDRRQADQGRAGRAREEEGQEVAMTS